MFQKAENQRLYKKNIIPVENAFDIRTIRVYKFTERGNPMGMLKDNYKTILDYARLHTHTLVHIFKDYILGKKETLDQQAFLNLVVYVLYCNIANPFEEKKLLDLFKFVISTLLSESKSCGDVLRNTFFVNLFSVFSKRRCMSFIQNFVDQALCDVLLLDDFDIVIENLTKPKEEPKVKERPTPMIRMTTNNQNGFFTPQMAPKPRPISAPTPVVKKETKVLPRTYDTSIKIKEISESTEEEKLISRCTTNLYKVCTKIISFLSYYLKAIPPQIKKIFRQLYTQCSQTFKGEDIIAKIIKPFFFKSLLMPIVSDPEFSCLIDFPILGDIKDRLQVVSQVLKHLALNTRFDTTSPYVGMNRFLDQNKPFVDKVIQFLITKEKKPLNQQNDLTQGIQQVATRVFKDLTEFKLEIPVMEQIKSPKEKPTIDITQLSSITISCKDVTWIVYAFAESEAYKKKDDKNFKHKLPPQVLTALNNILTSKSTLEAEKYLLMNYEDIEVAKYIPQEPKENKVSKKYTLQQILLSIGSNITGSKTQTLVECLGEVAMSEKISGNLTQAAVIEEMLRTLSDGDLYLFGEIKRDIATRKEYLTALLDSNKKLLIEIDANQKQIDAMTKERGLFTDFLENERLKPFLIDLSKTIRDTTREIISLTGSDEQDKKIRKTLETMNSQLKAVLKKPYGNELVNHHLRLKKWLIAKLYRNVNPPHKKDLEYFKKCEVLMNIKPDQLEIQEKYFLHLYSEIAKNELVEMENAIIPEKKLDHIIKCSGILMEMMRLSGDSFPAIDDFLPMFIYHIIKARSKHLASNLEFITRFMYRMYETDNEIIFNQNKNYNGEYWLRHFEAALLYIDTIDESIVKVAQTPRKTPNKENRGSYKKLILDDMEQFEKKKEEENKKEEVMETVDEIRIQSPEKALHVLEDEKEEKVIYEFENKEIGDISMQDLPNLLNEYKKLLEIAKNKEFE